MLLMTSDHEGLPMILLEAMTLSVPIISHGVGGIPHLLDHGNCGILVHDHSAPAYAREILRLAEDHIATSNITKLALNRVTTHYSAEQNTNKYYEEYKRILNTH